MHRETDRTPSEIKTLQRRLPPFRSPTSELDVRGEAHNGPVNSIGYLHQIRQSKLPIDSSAYTELELFSSVFSPGKCSLTNWMDAAQSGRECSWPENGGRIGDHRRELRLGFGGAYWGMMESGEGNRI